MSSGFPCGSSASIRPYSECKERSKPVEERNWVVMNRNCNYSVFSGGHYTRSDYSSVKCLSCGAFGRTKADYVDFLRDA